MNEWLWMGMENKRVQVGNIIKFSHGNAWFSPSPTNSSANAAVVKNGISGEEVEVYVLVSRIEICGYMAKETPHGVRSGTTKEYACPHVTWSVQWDWLHTRLDSKKKDRTFAIKTLFYKILSTVPFKVAPSTGDTLFPTFLPLLERFLERTFCDGAQLSYRIFLNFRMFKKRQNFLNNPSTSTEGAPRLLSAPSGRFW